MLLRVATLLLILSGAFSSSCQTWVQFDMSTWGLTNPGPSCVTVDANGFVWAADEMGGNMGFGVSRFDGTTVTHFDETDCPALTNGVRCMASDADGVMWFGVYGIDIVRYDGNSWTVFATPLSNPTSIAVDQDNKVWAVGYTEGLAMYNGSTWTHISAGSPPFGPPPACFASVFVDAENDVWVGDICRYLYRYDQATATWTTYTPLNSEIASDAVASIAQDAAGDMWFAYDYFNGSLLVSRYDGLNWFDYLPFPANVYTQYGGLVGAPDGKVWASSSNAGLWYWDGGPLWEQVGAPLPTNRASTMYGIAIAPNGAVWWGVYEWGAPESGLWTNDEQFNGLAEINSVQGSLSIVPNPASDNVTIDLLSSSTGGTLRMFAANGALVRTELVKGGRIELDREGLPSGVYGITFLSDVGKQASGRVIFE